MPFLMTDPIASRDVTFEFIPRSEGIVAELVQEGAKWFVKVDFDPVYFSEDSQYVDLIASDRSRSLSTKSSLLLCQRRSLEIGPRTLRFKSEGEEMVSSCIVRYRGKPSSEIQVVKIDSEISFTASAGDYQLGVRTIRLGRGIYRVHLSGANSKLHQTFANMDQPKIVWHIVTHLESMSVVSPILVEYVPFDRVNEENVNVR
jgi:hypothetical protein